MAEPKKNEICGAVGCTISYKTSQFPHDQTLSHLQSSLSNNRVILVREVHDYIMNGSTPSSIIYLYVNER
jgi:hypothetical protein